MRFLFLLTFISFTVACTNNPEGKTEDSDYGAWDTDADEFIDNDEFRNAFSSSPYYAQWNTDDDQTVDRSEFAQGFFRTIDEDGDGTLNAEEWQAAQDAYFGAPSMEDYQTLDTWDQDGDQSVQATEFAQVLEQADYLAEWDENGDEQLDEEEIANGVFTMWDTDANGVIEAEEFKEWDDKRVAQ